MFASDGEKSHHDCHPTQVIADVTVLKEEGARGQSSPPQREKGFSAHLLQRKMQHDPYNAGQRDDHVVAVPSALPIAGERKSQNLQDHLDQEEEGEESGEASQHLSCLQGVLVL